MFMDKQIEPGLLAGKGQVSLGKAVWIELGRSISDPASLYAAIIWGLGIGTLNLVMANPDAKIPSFISSVLVAFCVSYISTIPWRVKLLPGRPAFTQILIFNGLLAMATGYICFYIALLLGTIMVHGFPMLQYKGLHLLFSGISIGGFIIAVVGFYRVMGEDQSKREQRILHRQKHQEELAERARLSALRAQINPHFFFNALNTIAALIPERPADAERAVELLAKALRPALMREQPLLATLESELEIARAYGEIEKLRLGERIEITESIDCALLQRELPGLSLQPLLENAVKYGAGKSTGKVLIEIRAALEENQLVVSVSNHPDHQPLGELKHPIVSPPGHAIHNIDARLKGLFGRDARLIGWTNYAQNACKVTMILPQASGASNS